MELREIFLNESGVRTLWAAIKTELSKKVNVSQLENYMTDEEVEAAILSAVARHPTTEDMTVAIANAISSVKTIRMEIVQSLPEHGEANVIYFVPMDDQKESDQYYEYVYINEKPELIGSTKINLDQYWSKTELTAIDSDTLSEILV